jgi:hypothetical protein
VSLAAWPGPRQHITLSASVPQPARCVSLPLALAGRFFRCRVPGHDSSHTWTAGMLAPRFCAELAGTPQGSPGGRRCCRTCDRAVSRASRAEVCRAPPVRRPGLAARGSAGSGCGRGWWRSRCRLKAGTPKATDIDLTKYPTLTLNIVEGYSQSQIAEMLGISQQAVSKRMDAEEKIFARSSLLAYGFAIRLKILIEVVVFGASENEECMYDSVKCNSSSLVSSLSVSSSSSSVVWSGWWARLATAG